MVRVSVVVPTHNKKEMVTEAIESVLAQSYRDCELIVVDDGSTDGTPLHVFSTFGAQPEAIEILSKMNPNAVRPFSHSFAHDGIPIQYHYIANRGLSAARNRGIKFAHGSCVAFLEAEDLWNPAHLETHATFHEENDWARVSHIGECHVRDRSRAGKARKAPPASGWIFQQALETSPICISAAMAHRTCFAECGGFDENLPACEDYDLWLRFAARYPIHFLEGTEIVRRSSRFQSSNRSWTWDRYRVYALEKSFQSGKLNAEQRLLVAEEIVKKCERLVEGFKRQKSEERANFYERKRKRFALEVRKLRASQAAARSQAEARQSNAPATSQAPVAP
jgi:glycosyltransferase involved in cell wall biosynthesis